MRFSKSSIVDAWRLALAEIVAERKRFPDILFDKLSILKKARPKIIQLILTNMSFRKLAGIVFNLLAH